MYFKYVMYRYYIYIYSKLYVVYILLLNEFREMRVLKMVVKDWG